MVNPSRFASDPRIDKPWGSTLSEKLPRFVHLRYINWGAKECQQLRNTSSAYKQVIRSIYENSLDRLLRVEDRSVTAIREAPIFDVYPDPVESSQDCLDFITNALAKIQLKSC